MRRTLAQQLSYDAFRVLARTEGILPALETSHALAALLGMRAELKPGALVIVNLSGRGDKDLDTVLARERTS